MNDLPVRRGWARCPIQDGVRHTDRKLKTGPMLRSRGAAGPVRGIETNQRERLHPRKGPSEWPLGPHRTGHGQRMAFGPTEPQRGPGAGYRPRIAPYGPQKAPSPVPCDAKRAICMSPFRSERMGPGGHWPKGGLAPLLVGLGCCGHIMAHLGPCRPNLGHLEPASSGQRPEPPGRWGPKPCQLDALTQGCLSIDVEARVGSQAPA